MPNTIKVKTRTADATAPTAGQLAVGELAWNAFAGVLYGKKQDGTVVSVGGGDVSTSGSYANPSWITSLAASKLTGTVAVANGGTGASDAATARTNLGLGTIATQNANSVTITGGTFTGSSVAVEANATATLSAWSATNTAATTAELRLFRSRTSITSPSSHLSGDALGRIYFFGDYNGAGTLHGEIVVTATENSGVSARGAEMSFWTVANGATALTRSLTLTSTGINNTPIGATTRSTGAFTTLTLTNALSAANGGTGLTALSANVVSLLGAADYAAMRTQLSLVVGTNVQAYDAELAALAGLTSAADRLPYFTGSGTAALATFTTAARNLLDDADAATMRTTLGLGTIATQAANSVALTGGTINGTSIGATTPSTGAFTTLTVTDNTGDVKIGTGSMAVAALTGVQLARSQGFYASSDGTRHVFFGLDGSGNCIGTSTLSNHDLVFRTNNTDRVTLAAGGGVLVGAPTGGDKGAGTINCAGDIYKNNTAYTNPDYVLEHWATGRIELFKDKEGAAQYRGLAPLTEVRDYVRRNLHLPRFGQRANHGLFSGSDALLASLEEAYLYIFNLEERLARLER